MDRVVYYVVHIIYFVVVSCIVARLLLSSTLGSGVFVGLLGVTYFAQIHHIAYFIVVQIFVGVFQVRGSHIIVILNCV